MKNHQHAALLLQGLQIRTFVLLTIVSLLSCNKEKSTLSATKTMQASSKAQMAAAANLSVYIPNELRGMDFNNPASTWCYPRSRQSAHFVVFWGAGYGTLDPNNPAIPNEFRVDVNDLLARAETCYNVNIQTLKFAGNNIAASKLNTYKLMIFLFHETIWRATGSGYDNVIGSLFVSPSAVKAAPSAIAHEIGHSFQYQVFADQGVGGFRYGFGANGSGGNGYWESTANWQAYQVYPNEIFGPSNFPAYLENCHRHIHHEGYRYASYFMNYYWAWKRGIDVVARVWRESAFPEDPILAYMRIFRLNDKQLNDEVYEAATKFATWDIDALRGLGAPHIGRQPYAFDRLADGAYQVRYERCPGTTGYNIVPLSIPAAGITVNALLTGIPNAPGFNPVDAAKAGWRYGFVALLNNGGRVYGPMGEGAGGNIGFTVPQGCVRLWLVVTGAPSAYTKHAWDDNNANDEQWPYRVKFTGTAVL